MCISNAHCTLFTQQIQFIFALHSIRLEWSECRFFFFFILLHLNSLNIFWIALHLWYLCGCSRCASMNKSDSHLLRMKHKSDKIENLTKKKDTEINWKISRFNTKKRENPHSILSFLRWCFFPFVLLSLMFSLHSFPFIRIKKKTTKSTITKEEII